MLTRVVDHDIATDVEVALEPSDCTVKKWRRVDNIFHSLSEEITSKARKAFLNGLPIVNQNDDLCTDLKDGPTPRLLAKAHINQKLPNHYQMVFQLHFCSTQSWTTDDGTPILCLSIVLL